MLNERKKKFPGNWQQWKKENTQGIDNSGRFLKSMDIISCIFVVLKIVCKKLQTWNIKDMM